MFTAINRNLDALVEPKCRDAVPPLYSVVVTFVLSTFYQSKSSNENIVFAYFPCIVLIDIVEFSASLVKKDSAESAILRLAWIVNLMFLKQVAMVSSVDSTVNSALWQSCGQLVFVPYSSHLHMEMEMLVYFLFYFARSYFLSYLLFAQLTPSRFSILLSAFKIVSSFSRILLSISMEARCCITTDFLPQKASILNGASFWSSLVPSSSRRPLRPSS